MITHKDVFTHQGEYYSACENRCTVWSSVTLEEFWLGDYKCITENLEIWSLQDEGHYQTGTSKKKRHNWLKCSNPFFQIPIFLELHPY